MASTAVEFGTFNRLFPLMRPILHRAHFTPYSGIGLMKAFGFPITAVAMIYEFYEEGNYVEGKIDQKETLLTTFATLFPQTVYESLVHISPTILYLSSSTLGYLIHSLRILNGCL